MPSPLDIVTAIFMGGGPPLIRDAQQRVGGMIRGAEEMLEASLSHLLDNVPLDVDLGALDQRVNEAEQEVRRLVLEHLAIDPQRELGFSLVLVAAVQEAERLGDLAKTLAQIAQLADSPRLGAAVTPLRSFADRLLSMCADTRTGFTKGDARAARRVCTWHTEHKAFVRDYIEDLAGRSDVTPNEAVVYALSARVMGRVSSHLSNIVSSVLVPFDQIRRTPTS